MKRSPKRLLLIAPLVLTLSCAATVAGKYDQAHMLYNQASQVALNYAEQPNTSLEIRITVAEIVARTGPVVIRASQVLDDPTISSDERKIYLRWAEAVISEATTQLTDLVLGR